MKIMYVNYSPDLETELIQAAQEGRDIENLRGEFARVAALPEGEEKEQTARALFELTASAKQAADYKYVEPDALCDIRAARPKPDDCPPLPHAAPSYDKIYGAWLGRLCGCLLGKPFEGCDRATITGYLKETQNYPIRDYARYGHYEQARDKYGFTGSGRAESMADHVSCMPADDDINYTVLALCVMEQYGWEFTSEHIAKAWMGRLPINQTYTAERAAYRNFILGYDPPRTAGFCNPYREWIGAQIRADLYGYVTTDPELAAELAHRDSRVSHTKNGIYGAMAVAAMLAAAARTRDITRIAREGLNQIPARSRMAEAIQTALDWANEGISWEAALDRVHKLFDEHRTHDWCLATANMMIVIIALAFGNMDLGKTIGIAVAAGFDTDCNGATAGSILGMALGADALDKAWLKPLNDAMNTTLAGEAHLTASDAAARTLKIANSRGA